MTSRSSVATARTAPVVVGLEPVADDLDAPRRAPHREWRPARRGSEGARTVACRRARASRTREGSRRCAARCSRRPRAPPRSPDRARARPGRRRRRLRRARRARRAPSTSTPPAPARDARGRRSRGCPTRRSPRSPRPSCRSARAPRSVRASMRATSSATLPFPMTTARSCERSNSRCWKSGWPLYQATSSVAAHEPGRSSPGIPSCRSVCEPTA